MAFSMCKVRHKQLPQKVLHRENEAKFKAKPQQHELCENAWRGLSVWGTLLSIYKVLKIAHITYKP